MSQWAYVDHYFGIGFLEGRKGGLVKFLFIHFILK